MKKLFLTLMLCLLPAVAWGATYYVRTADGEYGAEDGSSYAAAFDGFGAAESGISANDTLYV